MTTAEAAPGHDDSAAVALARLRRFGGDDLVREMALIFYETSHERLAVVRVGVAADDRTAIARAAHSLKGSCGQIGAVAAERLSRELERAAHGATSCVLLTLADQVDRACAEYRAWLARELRREAEGP